MVNNQIYCGDKKYNSIDDICAEHMLKLNGRSIYYTNGNELKLDNNTLDHNDRDDLDEEEYFNMKG